MAEVDPVTGLPKELVEPKTSDRYNRLMSQKGQADQLNEDLHSEKGQKILNKIQEYLLNRVNYLIDNDGECRSLKKVLVDMGLTLDIGEVAVNNLLRLVTKK